jgi:hypothetical protein
MRGEQVKVEAYAGAFYPEEPRRVRWQGRWHQVREILRRWQEPGRRYFVVVLEGDIRALLCYYRDIDGWEIALPSGGRS